jgi:hypothetical protein
METTLLKTALIGAAGNVFARVYQANMDKGWGVEQSLSHAKEASTDFLSLIDAQVVESDKYNKDEENAAKKG